MGATTTFLQQIISNVHINGINWPSIRFLEEIPNAKRLNVSDYSSYEYMHVYRHNPLHCPSMFSFSVQQARRNSYVFFNSYLSSNNYWSPYMQVTKYMFFKVSSTFKSISQQSNTSSTNLLTSNNSLSNKYHCTTFVDLCF